MGNRFTDSLKKAKSSNKESVPDLSDFIDSDSSASLVKKAHEENRLFRVPCDLVIPDPDQPRKSFDEERLEELKRDIETNGQLQPILVQDKNDKGFYKIIAGERRWRAISSSSELDTILVVVTNSTKNESDILLMQISENLHRENISVYENAIAMKRVVEACKALDKDQAEAASLLNISKSKLSKYLSLLNAPALIANLSKDNETQDLESLYNLSSAFKRDPEAVEALVERFKHSDEEVSLRQSSKELLNEIKDKEKDEESEKIPVRKKTKEKDSVSQSFTKNIVKTFNIQQTPEYTTLSIVLEDQKSQEFKFPADLWESLVKDK